LQRQVKILEPQTRDDLPCRLQRHRLQRHCENNSGPVDKPCRRALIYLGNQA
jgi:hypothetical protein